MKSARPVTRREFLRVSAITGAGVVAAACAQTPATSVPAGGQAAGAPTQQPVTSPTQAIAGQVEELVAVPAPPDKFGEAPMLAELVGQGVLPVVEERLPAEPLVAPITRSIGTYGGTAYGQGISPRHTHDMQITSVTGLVDFSDDLQVMRPCVASSFKFNEDYTEVTVYLRKGVKWSDGAPFTADDMMFYFDDMQFDKDYSPTLSSRWKPGGEPMSVTKVDDFTVRFDFPHPYPSFPLIYKCSAPYEPFVPKHYVQKYHIKYNAKADEEAKAAGFNNWQAQLGLMCRSSYGQREVGVPVITPWLTAKVSQTHQYYERNPYYFEVDPEGNQLPYIDKWTVELMENIELFNMKAASGELSIAGLNLLTLNYPLLKESEEKGNYRIVHTYQEEGADTGVAFNQIHPDPVIREFFCNVKFRQAMSIAINRDEINDLCFLGMGTPRQATINESAQFFKQEWASAWAQYDPDLANKMLDELGLDKRAPDGTRLLPDGRPFVFMLEFPPQEGPKKEICELVAKHWTDVGFKVDPQGRDKDYLNTRCQAQEQDASGWMVNRLAERAAWVEGSIGSKLGVGGSDALTYANFWKQWLNSGGELGEEPPEEAKALWEAYKAWQTKPYGSPEYIEAGISVFDQVMERLYVIGTVGQAMCPTIVSNNLENVFPDDVLDGSRKFWWGASAWYWLPLHAEQWYFKSI